MPGFVKKFLLIFSCCLLGSLAYSQIGIGVNPPDPSAVLHVQDTTKGLLISRVTAAQRINIQNPAEGLMVYQTDSPAGFWYFRSGQWVNTFPSNGEGRSVIILADTISNAEAQLKIANEVGPNTQEVRILRCSNLTSVDLSVLTNSLVEVYIEDNAVLQNVNLGNLKAVDGGFYVYNCPQLASLDIHSLGRIGQAINGNPGLRYGLSIIGSGLQNLNLPILKQLTGFLWLENDSSLTSLNIPQLAYSPTISIWNCPLLASATFSSLKNLGVINMVTASELSTVDFSSLKTANTIRLKANQLSSVSFPVLTSSQIEITAPQLASASFPVLQVCNTFNVTGGSQLAVVSAPLLATSKIQLTGGSLNAVNLNSLQTATGIVITASAGSLTTLTFPALQTSSNNNNALINVSGIGTLSFPVLRKTDGFAASQLSSLSLPLLDTVKYRLDITNAPALTTLTFPALKKSSGITITNSGLTSASFPVYASNYEFNVGNYQVYINGNPNLTAVSLPNLQVIYGSCYFDNNKLPSSEVNALLAKFRSIPTSNLQALYLKQIPAAPPTGQGIIDKNYLVGVGVTVVTD
jgi:hypothetical protein